MPRTPIDESLFASQEDIIEKVIDLERLMMKIRLPLKSYLPIAQSAYDRMPPLSRKEQKELDRDVATVMTLAHKKINELSKQDKKKLVKRLKKDDKKPLLGAVESRAQNLQKQWPKLWATTWVECLSRLQAKSKGGKNYLNSKSLLPLIPPFILGLGKGSWDEIFLHYFRSLADNQAIKELNALTVVHILNQCDKVGYFDIFPSWNLVLRKDKSGYYV